VVVVAAAGLIVFQVEARQWAAGAVSLTALEAKGFRAVCVLRATTALAQVLPHNPRPLCYFTVFFAKVFSPLFQLGYSVFFLLGSLPGPYVYLQLQKQMGICVSTQ
jgi:hypothetical protein